MGIASPDTDFVVGLEHSGMLMTPAEFDALEEYDENYTYELIHGVLVVNPIPSAEETGPNEFLGYLLLDFKIRDARGGVIDDTLPQQHVRTPGGRRVADRLIWLGQGRVPDPNVDIATIAIEFVSAGKRSRQRDYVEKKCEYMEAGIQEYWIIERFRRTMTVVRSSVGSVEELVVQEGETYESPRIPGFVVPLARIFASADRRSL